MSRSPSTVWLCVWIVTFVGLSCHAEGGPAAQWPAETVRFFEQFGTVDRDTKSVDLHATHVPPASLSRLSELKGLKSLSLHDNAQVGDAEMKYVAALKSLERLNIRNTNITDAGIMRLAALGKLKEASLPGLMTAESLAVLAHWPRLEYLRLFDLHITPEAGEVFAKLESMRTLWIVDCEVEPGALKGLRNMQRLVRLDLRGSTVRDSDVIGFLPGLRSLRSLSLDDSLVGDEAVKAVAELPHVGYLSLGGTQTTSASVTYLCQMRSLAMLHIVGTALDRQDVAKLQSCLERARITWHVPE